jgi:hypothetical protein
MSPPSASGALVGRRDVRLNDHGHARLEREVRHGLECPALAPEDRREISTDEAVDEVVAGRESGIFDRARGFDHSAAVVSERSLGVMASNAAPAASCSSR